MVTITVETVAAAADRLHGDGTNPTQSAVRTALGGGSFSTIGPLLHKRRDNQARGSGTCQGRPARHAGRCRIRNLEIVGNPGDEQRCVRSNRSVPSGIVEPKFSSWVKEVLCQVVDVDPITVFGNFDNG